MNRRSLLKNLGLIAGGTMLLPACDFSEKKVSIALNNLKITADQEEFLKELVNTIIPADPQESSEKFPGAQELGVHNFVWVMVDDCMKESDQLIFINGLNKFVLYTEKLKDKAFEKLTQEERIAFLKETLAVPGIKKEDMQKTEPAEGSTDAVKHPPEYYIEDIKAFINTTKGLTQYGYMQSEYIMTEVMPYPLVPGGSQPCETIDPTKRINIYA
ncbi:gluconate 2-dehydrogenase subunit 3 family protein [Flexithrix dorotheae]|uniref:gluconate 2-dehydrogenase subunit 3 family protein n=1 Tax=Flexithrix dorotheae TaxID=70993 RepID=UPI00036E3A73|nr:gluconate 2-dehydrogenase subunit 3 family protein [Flexithrix dorotheae]